MARSSMANAWLAVCLLGALAGCYAVVGVEPTDLSTVRAETSRSDIEAVLGTPIESETVEGYRVDVYSYNTGSEGFYPGPTYNAPFDMVMALIYMTPIPHAIEYEGQRAYLAVSYSADDTVVRYKKGTDKEALLEQSRELIRHESQLRQEAERGDPGAQYNLADLIESRSVEQWTWYCRAAIQGHARAQFEIASYYEYGHYPTTRDLPRAYAWYKFAASNGYTSKVFYGSNQPTLEKGDDLIREMTAAQLAEAEKLVREWEPSLSDCKVLLEPTE